MSTSFESLRGRLPDWVWDTGLVALAVLLLVVELRSFTTLGSYLGTDAVAVLFHVAIMSGLLLRRRWPLAMALLVLASSYSYQALGYVPLATMELATLVILFSAAAHGRPLPRVAALGVIALWLIATSVASPAPFDVAGIVIMYVILVGAWMLGGRERAHRAYSAMLEERNALLEHGRALEAAQVAATERARIARELHDVIAHGLGVVVVQSEAALYAPEEAHSEVRDALHAIRSAARSSLNETRRILGMLRAEEAGAARAPQRGIADLPPLVDEFTAAGLDVHLEVAGNPPALQPGLDLSLYRIVEEALTNTLRHAHATKAWVTLEFRPEAVHLEVRDDGAGSSAAASASNGRLAGPARGNGHTGHGLVGMRERVTMLRGSFHAGPQREGGYAVRVTLPLSLDAVEAAS